MPLACWVTSGRVSALSQPLSLAFFRVKVLKSMKGECSGKLSELPGVSERVSREVLQDPEHPETAGGRGSKVWEREDKGMFG